MFTTHYEITKHAAERLFERTSHKEEMQYVLKLVKDYLYNNIMQMIWKCLVRGDEIAQVQMLEGGWVVAYKWHGEESKLRILTVYRKT